ncbi:MAG: 2-amino-4-hydroxy-6-hydroxymethyldihydropteridine diphosphokinase, partial [Nitrospirae bacterium]|nr:2-amino-4-hydroxy-6-hydroxymethyldihydropteridine diphosphokinase [Nitrospirota bacterium]
MAIVHISIGSNIGDREDNCRSAIKRMREEGIEIKETSSMHETEPWGYSEQPNFINMAVEATTGLTPAKVLCVLKGIESGMGRNTVVKWGPRIIDLDILFYDDLIINIEGVRIPHPLLQERD